MPRFQSGEQTARQVLTEVRYDGSEATDGPAVAPLIELIDHRRTFNDVTPAEWLDGLVGSGGRIAVKFYLAADHELWFGYDPEGDRWHHSARYPGGAWNHQAVRRAILATILEEIYEHDEVRRSVIVPVSDTPHWLSQYLDQDNE